MPTEPFHRLFFAVRPPVAVVPGVAALRGSLGQARGLVPDEQLHLTTWLFEDSQDFPADVADRARAAVATLTPAAFPITLDRMAGGRSHVVLLPSAPLDAFAAFQASLDAALRSAGIVPRAGWRFAPHLTLLHGRHEVDATIEPIRWTAQELVLIDSVVGQRRHDVVSRWTLE